MTTESQIHQISKIKKLIDLNGDTTNFDINFKVTSRNKEHFELLVVDQTTLDNTPNLEYKKVENGTISGNIVHDKNVYQNYFLILRADNPCECTIEIVKKELPKTTAPPPPPQQQMPVAKNKATSDGFNLVKILLIVGAVVALGVGFYLYSRKSNVVVEKSSDIPRESGFRFYSPPKSSTSHHSPSHHSPVTVPKSGGGNTLLDRLKNLNLT